MQQFVNDLKSAIELNQPSVFCLVTATTGSTPRKAGAKMLVFPDGSLKGSIGGGSLEWQAIQEALSLMKGGVPHTKKFNLEEAFQMHCGGSVDIYFEPIASKPDLYIFGGGHIGKALARYASGLGFRTNVFDQREDIFKTWEVTGIETHIGDFFQLIDSLEFTENTYAVIVTPQHEFDEKILLKCAPLPHAYLGMIGSRRKVAEIRKNALDSGLLTDRQLDDVDMPIGIPFAAETPDEIAISIVAKMIDVKNTRKKF